MQQHVSFNFTLMAGYVQKCLRVMPFPWTDLIKSSWRIGVILLSSKSAVFQVPLQKGQCVKDHEDDPSVLRVGYFIIQCWKYGIALCEQAER